LFGKLSPHTLSPKIYPSKTCQPTVQKFGVSTFRLNKKLTLSFSKDALN